jgi:TldD protein
VLLDALDGVERLWGDGDVRVFGEWVAFEQWVCVGRPGRPTGVDHRRRQRLRLEARVDRGGRRAGAVVERVLQPGEGVSADALASALHRRALERLEAAAPASRIGPVVFAAGVGGLVMHELVGHALEGDTVLRGASALASATGAALPSVVTVIDDPTSTPSGWLIDDEGEEARRTTLVESGRVSGRLHDQGSALLARSGATGHGRRASFRDVVRPRMGCTFLEPGTIDPGEVVASVEDGVHVRRMETASVDARTGEAFFRVTDADRIVKGSIHVPLEPFLLRIDMVEGLSTLSHVANDLTFDTCVGSCVRDGQPLPTTVGAPTFRIGMARVVAW